MCTALYSTENYIQYPMINRNGKNMKKRIYIYLNHFAVQQKLTQCCKSTILQFKKCLNLKKKRKRKM